VYVNDVDFHALATSLALGVVCLLCPAIHICGDNSLHMEELLIVSGSSPALFARAITVHVCLILDII
jgi:hypothetical protein